MFSQKFLDVGGHKYQNRVEVTDSDKINYDKYILL